MPGSSPCPTHTTFPVGNIEVQKVAKYRLHYFFDVWAGDCLWSANKAALERFGYPVFIDELGLSDEAVQTGTSLIQRLQDEVTRESLGYGIPHDEQFDGDAKAFLAVLRDELGPDFEILNEL